MQRYIEQLIEDLDLAANNPPEPAYIEAPPQFDDLPDMAELALAPFKSIEELTGIGEEAFPLSSDLTVEECEAVDEAIFRVFESLHIEPVDAPEDLPPDLLYDVLTTNWDYVVQYLPSSGFDLELCTGDPETCPHGDFCNCGEEFDEFELPEKFASCINPIAQSIDGGFTCYLNPETLEMEETPKSLIDDTHEFKMITGFDPENEQLKHESCDECYTFEPLDTHESFRIMESFAETNMLESTQTPMN
jgi:hypothetical protein